MKPMDIPKEFWEKEVWIYRRTVKGGRTTLTHARLIQYDEQLVHVQEGKRLFLIPWSEIYSIEIPEELGDKK